MPSPTAVSNMARSVVERVRQVVGDRTGFTPLHAPTLGGNAWTYVKECIDTGWVSSAGTYVTRFEEACAQFTGSRHAVATVNGTAALHLALVAAGVGPGDEVITQALTFVATANAIHYTGAGPHFVDVDEVSLGMDPVRLAHRLDAVAEMRGGDCYNRQTDRRIAAIVPMHTFGHPVNLDPLQELAGQYNLPVVEDAAESLGSFYKGRHTGTLGRLGILSFNGNKVISTGGGGMVLTDDEQLADEIRHCSTTAKKPHPWAYHHDRIGYNYRMPNLNAALGVSQVQMLEGLLGRKRRLADRYAAAFEGVAGLRFLQEPGYARSNYWLNAILLDEASLEVRDQMLQALIDADFQARPIWQPMHLLPMYASCPRDDLPITESLSQRVINLPSSAYLSA